MPKRGEPTKLTIVMDACNAALDMVEALDHDATLADVQWLRNKIEDAAVRFADRVRARKRERRKVAG